MDKVKNGDNVLLVLNNLDDTEKFKSNIQENVNITSISASKLNETNLKDSSFDCILYKGDLENVYSNEFLTKILTIHKPGGTFTIADVSDNFSKLEFELKVNGYTNISKTENGYLNSYKPTYEIGSSAKLNLKKKPAKAVWKIDDTAEDDMIDPDNLLEEDDLIKPDLASLKVCATTGKRKACRDCSCGLAEELEGEKIANDVNTANAKSSCGNCYLGDAFRCAACPYLGMPAFKPGEKVQLAGNLLKSDI